MGPFILGLTGSIGMGKSTVANMLLDLKIPVLDSDQVVHDLYSSGGGAVEAVAAVFGNGVVIDGAISRPELSKCVVGNPEAMKTLESIVHPLVQQEKRKFIKQAAQRGAELVVLDIPLLYETGAEAQCDAVAVVSAPLDIQRSRVLQRPGMSAEKFDAILSRQMPDEEKRRRADFVIDTGVSLEETRGHVLAVLDAIRGRKGTAYEKMVFNNDNDKATD